MNPTTRATSSGLSARGQALYEIGGIRELFSGILSDPYHIESNPKGMINLGTAENYIMVEKVTEFVNKNVTLTPRDVDYGEGPWGRERLRDAMSKYMNKFFNPSEEVKAENLLFATGCTSLLEMLAFTLFEAGDGLLLSRPCYQAFQNDFGCRAKVQCVYVPFGAEDQFTPSAVACYEEALKNAKASGIQIRAVILCSPHNPIGQCYSPSALIALMEFCAKNDLHLIVDEVYGMSTYCLSTDTNEDAEGTRAPESPSGFTSVLALDTSKYIPPTHLHVLYGFSKDLACGGLRLGVLWTRSNALIRAIGAQSAFNWPSGPSEQMAVSMLESDEWLDKFLKTSRAELGSKSRAARDALEKYGIAYGDKARAGFFLWVNVRQWLIKGWKHAVGEGEQSELPWEAEREFEEIMRHKGVYLTSGESMRSEKPGFFRLCFVKDEIEVMEGLRRLKEALDEYAAKGLEGGIKGMSLRF